MVAILILNWNGYKDTIACIKSIFQSKETDFFVVVGDNGSCDDSIEKIYDYFYSANLKIIKEQINKEKMDHVDCGNIIIYDMKTNQGFARGNNLMIKYARRFSPDYYFLLNNDTEVTSHFLSSLLSFRRKNPQYDVLAPLIPFYYEKDKIWNAGGKQFWGFRKYYYESKDISAVKERAFIKCTFLTGCAMLVSEKCMTKEGNLFTECFFFGEEDFELSRRLRKQHIRMACVLDSIVYHKVSSSSNKFASYDKIFIHYMNRYIDNRKNLSRLSFACWRLVNNIYLYYLLRKCFVKSQVISLIKEINIECQLHNGVSKNYFERRMGKKG